MARRQFGTTDSLAGAGEEAEQGALLDRAVGYARQVELSELWRTRSTVHDATPQDRADVGSEEEADDEDARTLKVMEEHPDYHCYFDDPDSLREDGCTEEGVNPFAHVGMHVIVESQLADNQPPEVTDCLRRLLATGMSRHEAIHTIAGAVSNMIYQVLSQKRPEEASFYVETLKKIVAEVERGGGKPTVP